ncbi:enoyl-CoA hydratase-related protein [Agilicoccus flavus]|uniref:enoyl-CoA hydratase-related protein n=1 Tax=Agilicoccus flavus TaxID=2775968 RepID=UPI001CF60A49|nr:enoyl-CoA hydratase-related protein [Agilicoccus flavus]
MNPQTVLVEVTGAVATITLNAPDRLNAVDAPMLVRVAQELTRLDADPAVRVISLTGAGRGFCSGAQLGASEPGAPGEEVGFGTLEAVGDVLRAIVGAGTPTVALVNGPAVGAGLSLALACDYVLATRSATLMLAFTKIGLMPDGGATALVAASVGRARALRLALTAQPIDASTAQEWGLIAEAVDDDAYAARSGELLARLAAGPTRAFAATTGAVNAATIDVEATLAREEPGQTALMGTTDFAEGVAAFTAKRPPEFTGV